MIELVTPGFPASEPGQFVQLRCSDPNDHTVRVADWPAGGFPSLAGNCGWDRREPFLRRPFSIADQWHDAAGKTHVAIVSRTVGPGTRWLERLAPDDTLNITGPLGRGFQVPGPEVPMVLVGGGVGIPPLLYLTRRLDELRRRDVTVIFGARSADLLPVRLRSSPATDGKPLPCAELAGEARFGTVITTDDGSRGMRGMVTNGLRQWHARRPGRLPNGAMIFACGPQAMLKAVSELTRNLGLGCQLCIERTMGCGLGTCLSCVVRVRDGARPEGWRWALACTDGPVFDRDQLCE